MKQLDKLTLVIIQYGDSQVLLEQCESIASFKCQIGSLIIVDNDGNLDADLKKKIRGLVGQNFGSINFLRNFGPSTYSGGVNIGLRCVETDFVCVCNNDLKWIVENAFSDCIEILQANVRVVVSPQLVYGDLSWQRTGGDVDNLRSAIKWVFGINLVESTYRRFLFQRKSCNLLSVQYVDGACIFVSMELVRELSGFDEDFVFYGEDADFCKRAADLGGGAWIAQGCRVVHMRGASSTQKNAEKYAKILASGRTQFIEKHHWQSRGIIRFLIAVGYAWRTFVLHAMKVIIGGDHLIARLAESRTLLQAFASR